MIEEYKRMGAHLNRNKLILRFSKEIHHSMQNFTAKSFDDEFNDFFKEINGFRWTLLSNLLLLLFTPYFDDYLLETDCYLASK